MKLIPRLLTIRDRLVPPSHAVLGLALRIIFGWQFFLTGKGKLANLDRTTAFFTSIHLPAPGVHAVLVGLLELVGGLLLIAGLGTRATSLALASTMVVAYLTAHRADAFTDLDAFMAAAPFPFLFAMLVIAVHGAGALSLDALIVKRACPLTPSAA